jgi:acetylornithine deacetylase/succinyl-diaminopimelate desuccinylase-like protein
MKVLTALKDENGRVTIPGFYDDVKELSSERREALSKLSYSESDYKSSIGAKALEGETGYSTYERRWHRPTLDVNGIWGGYTGEGSKTVIPNIATAKFSMRLVANQDPQKILNSLTQYLNDITPAAATVSLTCYSQAMPAQVDDQHPAIQAGLVALENAFGVPAVLQGEGGTIPVVADFKRELGLDTVLMGFNLPDDGIHAPNERFALDHFYRGMEASAWFFDQFATSYSKGV